MASVQVCRFQKRVLNLRSHHDLATQRNFVAVKSYEDFSRSMMNSLVTHLAENDKKLKKTKRISKPRTALSQGMRSTRPNDLVKPADSFPPYTGFTNYGTIDDPCISDATYQMFPPQFSSHDPKLSGNVNFDVRHPVVSSSSSSKEPIFPPPTYADPSASNAFTQQCSSSGSGPFEDYMSCKSNFGREYPMPGQGPECEPSRYGYFHPQHPGDLSYRRSSTDIYCTDSNFHSGLMHQPPNFPAHHQTLPHTQWNANSARDPAESLDYGSPFLPSLDPCMAACNGKYSDPYAQYSTKPVPESTHDYRDCARSARTDNLTVIPRTAGSSYSGINPILASTYPVVPGNRSDKLYASLSTSNVGPGQTKQASYRPPNLTVNNMQVPDRPSFNSVNYL